MNYNKWQLKAAAKGNVTSSSDWDKMTLVQVYNTLRSQGYSPRIAMETTEHIKADRLWAMTDSQVPHVSKDQAFAWLVESGVSPYTAARRVWGYSIPKDVYQAIEAAEAMNWSRRNAEHRQALEDARMAG